MLLLGWCSKSTVCEKIQRRAGQLFYLAENNAKPKRNIFMVSQSPDHKWLALKGPAENKNQFKFWRPKPRNPIHSRYEGCVLEPHLASGGKDHLPQLLNEEACNSRQTCWRWFSNWTRVNCFQHQIGWVEEERRVTGENCIYICLGGQVKGLHGPTAVLNNVEVKL